MTTEQKHFVVVNDDLEGRTAGGVQNLVGVFAKSAEELGHLVSTARTGQVLATIQNSTRLGSRCIVFVQPSGRLSKRYRSLCREWIENGATVVEKNVFALASRYRPRSCRYHVVVMTNDGRIRMTLRSWAIFRRQHHSVTVLPNPMYGSPRSKSSRPRRDTESITMARVGRPDRIKWSTFEADFAIEVAHRNSTKKVRLIRVGCPPEIVALLPARLPLNLKIEDRDYGSDLDAVYREADVYVHHSRIGETFGNTLAEAARFLNFIIYGGELSWDYGAPEVCGDALYAHGAPESLLRRASVLIELLPRYPPSPPVGLGGLSYVDQILRITESSVSKPSVRMKDVLAHFGSIRKNSVDPKRGQVVEAVAREVARAFLHQLGQEDTG